MASRREEIGARLGALEAERAALLAELDALPESEPHCTISDPEPLSRPALEIDCGI